MIRISQILLASIIGFAISAQGQQSDSATQSTTRNDNVLNSNLDKAGDTSVGFKWGDLSGIEFKHWSDQDRAWVVGFASEEGDTAMGIDYLWHFRDGVAEVTGLKNTSMLVPYIGVGLLGAYGEDQDNFFERQSEDFGLAIRAPIGIEFLPSRISLGVFAELAPSFGFAPTSSTFITADIGARYYF